MKTLFLFFFCLTGFAAFGQQKVKPISIADSTKKIQVVETACGQCQFGLKEKGCLLAVRIKGQAYFVDGTSIDEHGDAHADDGFCNAVRKAEVQGTVTKGRFIATYFKLLPGVVPPSKEQ
jgi:Family of unknown function (DUF6370)